MLFSLAVRKTENQYRIFQRLGMSVHLAGDKRGFGLDIDCDVQKSLFFPSKLEHHSPEHVGQCTRNKSENSASSGQCRQHWILDQKNNDNLERGSGLQPGSRTFRLADRVAPLESSTSLSLSAGPKQASVSIAIFRPQNRSWGITRIRAGGTPDPIHIANMDAHHLVHASPPSVALFPRSRPHQSTSTHSLTPWPNQLPRSHWPTAP